MELIQDNARYDICTRRKTGSNANDGARIAGRQTDRQALASVRLPTR